ncbi:MAG: DUF3098 domain-containing protein [Prevotellaceae bacterium]|jgi:hypothetical protein|nr:DUF3098 domain-containing protein [Prevotellaceae bacterium]
MAQNTTATKKPAATADKAAKQPAGSAVDKQQYKYIALGIGVIVLGFLLILEGWSDGSKSFSFTRTLAPGVVCAGIAIEIYAIMRKPKNME